MKTTLLTGFASLALAWGVHAQDPTVSPAAPGSSPAATFTSPTISPAASASPAREDDLENRIKKRMRGVRIDVDRDRDRRGSDLDIDPDIHIDGKDLEDIGALAAIPIVAIIFGTLALFGAPVIIVGAILLFTYLRQRSLHRTVRMMVEKGQPVPPALFAPPPVVRARSDMRRGVVLMAIGLGVMFWLAAVNDWEGGAWTLGLIPFLIGAGYLTVWRLEGNKPGLMNGSATVNRSTDNPPPLP